VIATRGPGRRRSDTVETGEHHDPRGRCVAVGRAATAAGTIDTDPGSRAELRPVCAVLKINLFGTKKKKEKNYDDVALGEPRRRRAVDQHRRR